MLARRALHSAMGWLMCRVFCKSIRFKGLLPLALSNNDATWFSEAKPGERPRIVFSFFTLLYLAETLDLACRINHKSPVSGQFRQIFT